MFEKQIALSQPPFPTLAALAAQTAEIASSGQSIPLDTIRAAELAFGCPMLDLWGITEFGGSRQNSSP